MSRSHPAQDPTTQVASAQADDPSIDREALIRSYEEGPARLREALAGMSPEQWRARPVPGLWSTLEVLAHLADCEQFFADRMKRTIGMDRPLLIGVDGFRYAHALHYQDRDPAEELDLIAITRGQMARILRLVGDEAWARTAVHTETGLVTLRQLVLHAVRHQEHHLRFVAEKRLALEGR